MSWKQNGTAVYSADEQSDGLLRKEWMHELRWCVRGELGASLWWMLDGEEVGWLSPWDHWVSLPGGGQSENLGWSRVMSWEEIGKSVINLGLMLMCVCVVLTH